MGFVHYSENGFLTDASGKEFYVTGINYVAKYACTNFWEDFENHREEIRADLKNIAAMGLNAIRIPMFWGYMEPELGDYNPDIFPKFDSMVSMCAEYGIYMIPWFLVGTATKAYDVPYRQGRPFLTGVMAKAAADHVKHFVKNYTDCEQILCWDICDEPEFYADMPGAEQWPYDRSDVRNWVKGIYDAIKSVDRNHMVSLGFGHIAAEHFGMHIRDMAEILDTMMITAYPNLLPPESCDCIRFNYFMQYNVRFNDLGKNIFTCEAPGYSDVIYSRAAIGRYYHCALYSNLINKSKGVLPWCYNDFAPELWNRSPLTDSTFEPYFGIVTNSGEKKPDGLELEHFASWVKEVKITDYAFADSKVAIYVPRGYYEGMASGSFNAMFHCFIYLKGLGVDVDFVWEDMDFSRYDVIVVASSYSMYTPDWEKLMHFAENGGDLVWVFDDRTGLCAHSNPMFGMEVQCVEQDYGDNRYDGGELSNVKRSCCLKMEDRGCRVISRSASGDPLFTEYDLGKGRTWLITKPLLENLFDLSPDAYLENPLIGMLDQVLASRPEIRPVKYSNPAIECGVLTARDGGRKLVILVNHSNRPQSVKADFTALREQGYDVEAVQELQMEACGVKTMVIRR